MVGSARVDGKPRIVTQQYLGSAAEVAAREGGKGPDGQTERGGDGKALGRRGT